MNCPKCGGDSQCKDSRLNANNEVRRRRQCVECRHLWTTHETITPMLNDRMLRRSPKEDFEATMGKLKEIYDTCQAAMERIRPRLNPRK